MFIAENNMVIASRSGACFEKQDLQVSEVTSGLTQSFQCHRRFSAVHIVMETNDSHLTCCGARCVRAKRSESTTY